MKLQGLSRVRNEGDVIEEFVRHNLRFLDGLTVVDHASVDGTLALLHALAAEGLPLTVVSDPAPLKLQSETMTYWSHRMLEERAWDFLFLLDADEFLKVPSRDALIESLAAVPPATHCLQTWTSYVATVDDDASVHDVLRRIRFRRLHESEPAIRKAVVSRDAAREAEFWIAEGNHSIETPRNAAAPAVLKGVRLAHFPVRSVAQIQAKVLVGWSSYLSLGYDENAYGWHQERLFRELESSARWTEHDLQRIATLYADPGRSEPADLVLDPIPPVDGVRYRDAAITGPMQVVGRYVRQLAEIIANRERPGGVEPASEGAVRVSEAVAALRRHLERRLERADLVHSPFPHIVVPDLFPAEVYADVLRFNPFATNPGSEWLPREQSDNVSTRTPYFTRKQIDLAAGEPAGGAPGAAAFWATIRETFLADHWFARLVAAKCEAYFRLRFGDLLDDDDFFSLMSTQLFLQRHEPGFELSAHTDLPTRIFTCIFSFADRDGFEEYGTQLLAHEDRLVRCWGTDHHPRDGFAVKKLVPYRPNGFLLFLKTRHSFHGVAKVDERVPNQRYGMQFQFHEPVGGVFRDLSEPDLMQFPRPRAPR